MDILGANMDI